MEHAKRRPHPDPGRVFLLAIPPSDTTTLVRLRVTRDDVSVEASAGGLSPRSRRPETALRVVRRE